MTNELSAAQQRLHGFYSIDAATGETFGEPLSVSTLDDVAAACEAAEAAFPAYRALPLEERASFLEAIASEIENLGDDLIVAAMRESGLPRARLEGERGRTTGQLKLFANVVRSGNWLGLRIDPPLDESLSVSGPHQIDDRRLWYTGAIGTEPHMADVVLDLIDDLGPET